ncbi:hypothetical protein FSHL1_007793 [Fusarium sambucinum]
MPDKRTILGYIWPTAPLAPWQRKLRGAILLFTPHQYECAKYGQAQTYRSIFSEGDWTQVTSCDSGSAVLSELKVPTKWSVEAGYISIKSITMHAPMFQLTGPRQFETAPATNTESATLAPMSAEASQSNMGSYTGGGLSTGARAGIGVEVGAVDLGLIGAAFYLRRRTKGSKAPPKSTLESSQLDSREVKPPGELGGTPLSPPPQYAPVELDGTTARQELP